MDDELNLITESFQLDDYGVRRKTESKTAVFCKVSDVTRAEFFGGGRSGLNPSKTFTIFAADYNDAEIVEHDNKRYAIYRTFHVPGTDYMELYAERRGGTNAAAANGSSEGNS